MKLIFPTRQKWGTFIKNHDRDEPDISPTPIMNCYLINELALEIIYICHPKHCYIQEPQRLISDDTMNMYKIDLKLTVLVLVIISHSTRVGKRCPRNVCSVYR